MADRPRGSGYPAGDKPPSQLAPPPPAMTAFGGLAFNEVAVQEWARGVRRAMRPPNPIRVALHRGRWWWQCLACGNTGGYMSSPGDTADRGREHYAHTHQHIPACRDCGGLLAPGITHTCPPF